MNRPRVLILDPDHRGVQFLREHLLKHGFEVNAMYEFRDTRFLRETNSPHIIILDVQSLGTNGFDVLKTIRNESSVPVVVVSEKADVMDRITGLELGADDYLSKPTDPRELIARIKNILKRAPVRENVINEHEAREWRFKGLVVQSNRRRVTLDGTPTELTTAEFDLLRLFVSSAQQILSRELILEQLRGIEWEAVDRSIDILVSRLRDKLKDDPRRPRFIRTVRSVGYQFVGELEDTEPSGSNPL